jgi:hypothetical protein
MLFKEKYLNCFPCGANLTFFYAFGTIAMLVSFPVQPLTTKHACYETTHV